MVASFGAQRGEAWRRELETARTRYAKSGRATGLNVIATLQTIATLANSSYTSESGALVMLNKEVRWPSLLLLALLWQGRARA